MAQHHVSSGRGKEDSTNCRASTNYPGLASLPTMDLQMRHKSFCLEGTAGTRYPCDDASPSDPQLKDQQAQALNSTETSIYWAENSPQMNCPGRKAGFALLP